MWLWRDVIASFLRIGIRYTRLQYFSRVSPVIVAAWIELSNWFYSFVLLCCTSSSSSSSLSRYDFSVCWAPYIWSAKKLWCLSLLLKLLFTDGYRVSLPCLHMLTLIIYVYPLLLVYVYCLLCSSRWENTRTVCKRHWAQSFRFRWWYRESRRLLLTYLSIVVPCLYRAVRRALSH